MSQKELIRREVQAIKQRIRGRVIGDPELLDFDQAGADFHVFIAPGVDIGGNRILEQVPIKINGPKARHYARNGSPVFLEKDGQGRYQIVGPADRVPRQGNLILVDEDTDLASAGGAIGFTTVREPHPFYQGTTPESFFDPGADGNTLVWIKAYDRALGLPVNINPVTDVDGAAVIDLTDLSGNGHTPVQTTGSLQPLYRKFDSTTNNSNTRSVVDFDGTDDRMTFPGAVTETTPGEISIFIMLQKEAAGAGDDVVLELDDWRIFSRRAGGDTWGFDQGGGIVDSTSALTTSYVLIELVAVSFADINLFQDGVLLGNHTPGGAGLGLGTSAFGGSVALGDHNGRVAEVLIMDETVSAAKRVLIESYFNRTMFVAFAKWNNGTDGYPKIRTFDADGNEVVL